MSSLSRPFLAIVAVVLVLSACGGSETLVVDDGGVADTSSSAPAAVASDQGAAQAPAPATGQKTATVTLSTGETFDLDVRSCDTQATDPNSLLNDDFVDLSGDSTDGQYYFQVLNATFAEAAERPVQVGLTGERDENGVNPKIDYLNFGTTNDPTVSFVVVDGARVTGQAPLVGKFSENKLFGETVTATFEFNCG